jgi:hypothetical protein
MGAEAVSSFREFGFIVIRSAFSDSIVKGAKQELQRMLWSEDPDCESVYFEGSVTEKIAEAHTAMSNDKALTKGDMATAPKPAGGKHALALGTTNYKMPNLSPEVRGSLIRKFMGFTHRGHQALLSVAEHPPLLAAVEMLLGANACDQGGEQETARLFQDMAMIKPPFGGREKPFHQDHAYFNYSLDTPIVGCWIALGTATEQNGAMVVVPRGHKAGPIVHFKRRDFQICDSAACRMQRVAVTMAAGDVLLFHSQVPPV